MKEDRRDHGEGAACAASLTILPCGERYDQEDRAEQAADRFFRAASVLPQGSSLCWQLAPAQGGSFSLAAFSEGDAPVTTEDFGWIFLPCAEVKEAARVEPLNGEGRTVYSLVPEKEPSSPPDSCTSSRRTCSPGWRSRRAGTPPRRRPGRRRLRV